MAKKYCPNCASGAYFCYSRADDTTHYFCSICLYDSDTPEVKPPIPPNPPRPISSDPVQAQKDAEEYIRTFGYTCCRSKIVGKHAQGCISDHAGRAFSWGT